MSKKAPMVPYRYGTNGTGIWHDTDYMRGAISDEEAERADAEIAAKDNGSLRYGVAYVMREAEPFQARLTYKGFQRHGYSVYLEWEDEHGGNWPMFLPELDKILRTQLMDNGSLPLLAFEPIKRGRAYGIRMIPVG